MSIEVRELTTLETAALAALQRWLLDDEQRPGEPDDVETRLKERLFQAREMPEHARALELIGDEPAYSRAHYQLHVADRQGRPLCRCGHLQAVHAYTPADPATPLGECFLCRKCERFEIHAYPARRSTAWVHRFCYAPEA